MRGHGQIGVRGAWARTAAALSVALASTTWGIPRDQVTFIDIPSHGLMNTPANEVRSVTFDTHYTATRVMVSGSLTRGVESTWASDARIAVYAPHGTVTVVQPFTQSSFEGTLHVDAHATLLSLPLGTAAGTWQFVFFEDVVDTDEGYDSIWDSITFTFDDEPPPGGWLEVDDAGELVSTAQRCEGFGSLTRIVGRILGPETDVYAIQVCDPANFSASTVGRATFDTQLFLFRQDGIGVAMNDDDPLGLSLQSRLSGQFVMAPGEYLLAIAQFNRKPRNVFGASLWLDQPTRVERAPDGPAAGSAFARWQMPVSGAGGTYEIDLTGACFVRPSRCPADVDDGNGTGIGDGAVDVSDLLFFLDMYEAGDLRADLDNGGGAGVRDEAVDIADLVYFMIHFEGGC